jgi:pilus assembly protein Flp/PilA
MIVSKLNALIRDEDGATLVEYGLVVALIAVAAITAVTLLGTNISATFNTIAGHFTGGTAK